MFVSVILPVKDEPYAEQLKYEIHKHLKGYDCEVLFQFEEGIANAVYHGIQRAKGNIIAIMDSDGSHSPLDLLLMVNYLEKSPKANLIIGERFINYYPFHRKMLSHICAWITRNFLNLKVKDPLSAFIVGKKEAIQYNNFVGCKFLLDIIMKVPKDQIATFPVVHRPRNGHKSKLKMIEGIYLLKQLVRLKCESFK